MHADHLLLQLATLVFAITGVRCAAIRFGWAFPDWLTYKPLR
ncbi:MAG TPA: hypothetical protein VJ011_08090 [Steroidobacteraceae bacterium]|nr:hypothetical protein [Steroidobacteraceae bacterium]